MNAMSVLAAIIFPPATGMPIIGHAKRFKRTKLGLSNAEIRSGCCPSGERRAETALRESV
jgi:hypothetical protein